QRTDLRFGQRGGTDERLHRRAPTGADRQGCGGRKRDRPRPVQKLERRYRMNVERRVVAARGTELRCLGWRQEGLLRMLENVLEVGERPEDLIVYASLAKAARDWPAFDSLVAALKTLRAEQTLVVQSGKPIGVFPSHPLSPIVVMATSNIVGHYATPENFYALAERGLTMWGGLTAGDWQYIGSQGVLQGIYEVLSAVSREHFGGSIAGRLVLTAGLGGMGSAQPVAFRMLGAIGLVVEVDPAKLQRSLDRGDLAATFTRLDDALEAVGTAKKDGRSVTVGLLGNAPAVFTERYTRPLFCRGIGPFRWVALSGERSDLARLDDLAGELFPERPEVRTWIELARAHVAVQGLPARSCWLGHGERSKFGAAVNA